MSSLGDRHAAEIASGDRFEFGKNWQRFLSVLNEERIDEAVQSLKNMLQVDSLEGKTFLDIGCGSGLFSLAARRLGARVHSLDYDPHSVACARELKRRFFPDDHQWSIEPGSILDREYIAGLGTYDIVYSWGVLHHTGEMWNAFANALLPVADGGTFFIAIYNDQGWRSKAWRLLKKIYCGSTPGRWMVTLLGSTYFFLVCLKEDLVRFRNPFRRYREYKKNRGMSMFHDWLDWFGGYPFEVARVDTLVNHFADLGFQVTRLTSVGGALGCNEFVFRKLPPKP